MGRTLEIEAVCSFQTLAAIYQYCVAPQLEGVGLNPFH